MYCMLCKDDYVNKTVNFQATDVFFFIVTHSTVPLDPHRDMALTESVKGAVRTCGVMC